MSARHVAIFSCPSPALVNPTLPVVATLVRRGYRVTYVTSETFAPTVAALGAEVVRCPRIEFPFNQDTSDTLPVEQQYATNIPDLVDRTLALVEPFYEHAAPDLVLYDSLAYCAPIIARKAGAPMIRMSTQFAFNEETLSLPLVPAEWRATQQSMGNRCEELLERHGLHGNVLHSREEPTVYFYARELQLGEDTRQDPHHLYAARCAAERFIGKPWKSQRRDEARSVLISASTVYDQAPEYYRKCLEALSSLRWHAVLAIGANNDPSQFDPLPPRCEIVQGTPLVAILPHMDLIICSGGMATTMEAMYHGRPLLMLSQGIGQLQLYARNAADHGLGYHLEPGQASVENLTKCAVDILTDSTVRQCVRRMQGIVKRSPGAEEVVNWLEEKGLDRAG
jgi:MGT family glycosyltransferase